MRKKSYFLLLILITLNATNSFAQSGIISTFATGSYCNVAVDAAGVVYSAGGSDGHVYRFDASGVATSIAGGGSSYGDGGPATNAHLTHTNHITFDTVGNMYIADGNGTVRRVNWAGTISTVAGIGTLGNTGDGGPATAAQIVASHICVDKPGNIYIADYINNVIRKVSTSGIISTVAGNGSIVFGGDGGPATAAGIFMAVGGFCGLVVDDYGNLFFSDGGHNRIRKVDTSGIINTVPITPTSTIVYPEGLVFDAAGNLYMGTYADVLEMLSPAGVLSVVAGNYISGFGGDGGPATAASLHLVTDVALDPFGNIYVADCLNDRIRKISGGYYSAAYLADSFSFNISKLCNGPQITVLQAYYTPGTTVKAYFGDGTSSITPFTPGTSCGYAAVSHSYSTSGTYSIKLVLYHGAVAVDSLFTSYHHVFCSAKSVSFYYDHNSNCIRDILDHPLFEPVLTEVDSNGIAIDTISSIGAFYYTTYGNWGDVYQFRVLSAPTGMIPICPFTGIIKDTLRPGILTLPASNIGFQCTSATDFDLAEHAIIPVTGMNDQSGKIYVNNNTCLPTPGNVTLHFSPKYQYNPGSAHPVPVSATATSLTWSVSSLTNFDGGIARLSYKIDHNTSTGYLTAGDTVHSFISITPSIGDINPDNNTEMIIDTVRASCDPNEIEVSPAGHISPGTQLQYTIHFENTGTDMAYNIYVMDTLSDNLDPTSLRMVTSSVPNMHVSKSKDMSGRTVMKFDFPNINLLDSFHHDSCIAMFVYTINAKSNLPDCTPITARAGIYFDYNSVCMTNEAENIIGCWPSSVSATEVSNAEIYPNPVTENLNIKVNNGLHNSYVITNSIGVVLMSQAITSPVTQVNLKNLPGGIYYLTLKGSNGSVVKRFVKM